MCTPPHLATAISSTTKKMYVLANNLGVKISTNSQNPIQIIKISFD